MSQHHARIKNDPRYLEARRQCLERDGYQCIDCGSDEQLEADHLITLEQIAATGEWELAWDLDNLATRCKTCNTRRYHDKPTEYRQEWISPAYPEISDAINNARSLTA